MSHFVVSPKCWILATTVSLLSQSAGFRQYSWHCGTLSTHKTDAPDPATRNIWAQLVMWCEIPCTVVKKCIWAHSGLRTTIGRLYWIATVSLRCCIVNRHPDWAQITRYQQHRHEGESWIECCARIPQLDPMQSHESWSWSFDHWCGIETVSALRVGKWSS